MDRTIAHALAVNPLNWHVLLETLADGNFAAWVAELPESRVISESEEGAIATLEALIEPRITNIKVLQFDTESPRINPWRELFGLYKDSKYFDEVMEIIQSERDRLGDEDIDPKFYMPN
jgi:hypothetical protein